MTYYSKKPDKTAGQGLALTEWNDVNKALGGDVGLTLALSSEFQVGIGIKETDAKLHVHEAENTQSKILISQKSTSQESKVSITNNSGQLIFSTLSGSTLSAKMVIESETGNVGIGKKNPQTLLDVDGTITASSFVGDGSKLTNLSVGVTGLNLATGSGTVGIGTTSPEANTKLHVVGNTKVDKNLEVNGDIVLHGSMKGGSNGSIPIFQAGTTIVNLNENGDGRGELDLTGNYYLMIVGWRVDSPIDINEYGGQGFALFIESKNNGHRIVVNFPFQNGESKVAVKWLAILNTAFG